MGKSKKRIEKSIESFEKLIEEHSKKIDKYEGEKDYLKGYWEKQISTFRAEKTKQEKKLRENLKITC